MTCSTNKRSYFETLTRPPMNCPAVPVFRVIHILRRFSERRGRRPERPTDRVDHPERPERIGKLCFIILDWAFKTSQGFFIYANFFGAIPANLAHAISYSCR